MLEINEEIYLTQLETMLHSRNLPNNQFVCLINFLCILRPLMSNNNLTIYLNFWQALSIYTSNNAELFSYKHTCSLPKELVVHNLHLLLIQLITLSSSNLLHHHLL